METNKLNEILLINYRAKEHEIQNYELKVKQLPFLKLRDIIISDLGRIDFEDLESQVYIAVIPGGILKQNSGIVAFNLNNDLLKIAIYSKEGIISQHTGDGILSEIKKAFRNFLEK